MKKISAILLALVMLLSMFALADGETNPGSITVTGTTSGKVYDIYKIFDLTQNGTNVAYTIDADWTAFFAGAGAAYIVDSNNTGNLNAITVNGAVKYINITDDNIEAFAQAALTYAASKDADATKTAAGTTVEFTNLELGYYLVYPQGATDIADTYGSICSLTSTIPTATVAVKATYPTIEKTDDKESADVGDTVNYTVTGKVPDTTGFTTYTYTVSDTMSDGLTFNEDIVVTVGGTVVTNECTITVNGNSFTVTIPVMDYTVGDAIEITYSATVNENAVAQTEENKANLTYSNDPQNSQSTTTTPDDIEKVHTSEIVIDKVDGETDAKLSGAEFVLYKMDGTEKKYYKANTTETTTGEGDDAVTTVTFVDVEWVASIDDATKVVTDANGAANFPGLADGTYYLHETVAPAGYNLLTQDVAVTVPATNAETGAVNLSVSAQVENNSGSSLPSTGGIGTTIFYVVGGLMMAAAVVLLVAKKKVAA